jgi:uncharacterized protein involved in exopolysaccharide biosynthesis
MSYNITIKSIVFILYKHKNKVIIASLSTVLTILFIVVRTQDVYEASTSILIRFGREYVYESTLVDKKSPTNYFYREGVMHAEVEILESRDLAEKVLLALGVEQLYPDLLTAVSAGHARTEAAIARLKAALLAKGLADSDVIRIAFQHPDARMAANVVNLLVDLYKEKHLHIFNEPQTLPFLEKHITLYYQQLKEAEQELERFKQQYGAFSLEEQQSLLLRQRSVLDDTLKSTHGHISALQEKILSLEKQIQKVSQEISLYKESEQGPIVNSIKSNLVLLQSKEQELLQKFTANHPEVISVRNEINMTMNSLKKQQNEIKSLTRVGKNVVHQDIEREMIIARADLQSQLAKKATLEQQFQQLEEQLQALVLREKELHDRQRHVATAEHNYRRMRTGLEEARISDHMDRHKLTNISVIQEATPPRQALGLPKRVKLLIGLVFGVCAGVGVAFGAEYVGKGCNTPESIEQYIGLPVLATVAYQADSGAPPYSRLARLTVGLVCGICVGLGVAFFFTVAG